MIEMMKLKLTFTQSEIQDGDIICFQVDINDKESVYLLIFYSHDIHTSLQDPRSGEPGPILQPYAVLRLLAKPGNDCLPAEI